MYCKDCGKEIEDKSTFCSFCGSKINNQKKLKVENKRNKYFLGIGIFVLLVVIVFWVLIKKDAENVGMPYANTSIAVNDEKSENENSVEDEKSEIKKDGLTPEIRSFLLQKSDEYGQTRSNYASLSVEHVIVEGYLDKKDKSKDATMEEDDPEYYYITLEKPMNIPYESYLDECVLEEYMDTIKLDVVDLDSLCGKKVYCCGKVIDPGVASSGIHMITAVVIDADNENLESEGINFNKVHSSKFVSDCSEENYNKVGNTMANIIEGGYVTVQGDWMYYALPQYGKWGLSDGKYCIYKEPVQGGTPQLIYMSQEDDIAIKYLNVLGDYIFFQEKTIKSIRCDGNELKDYGFNVDYGFYVVDEYILYAKETVISATESEWYLVWNNLNTQIEDNAQMVDPEFWGIEDTGESLIIYFGQDWSRTAEEGNHAYYEIEYSEGNYNFENIDDGISSFDHVVEPQLAYKPYRKYLINPSHIYNMQNQEIICQKEYFYTENFYFEDEINFINDCIVGYGVVPGSYKGLSYCTIEEFINNKYHYINGDKPEKILTAGEWIYYNCNNGVHRVKLDGSGYQEM